MNTPHDPSLDGLPRWATITQVSSAHLVPRTTVRGAVRRTLAEGESWVMRADADDEHSPYLIDTLHPTCLAHVKRWTQKEATPEEEEEEPALPHRRDMQRDLLRMGRWLAQHHPEVLTPADFTRELAAEVVAAVNEMTIGDFSCENLNVPLKHPGRPWSAGRKHGFLGVLRRCFSEMIDWGWMERRLNPQRVFATPRHLKHQFRVAPRTISDDLWAIICTQTL